jgi:Zn-dependent peptidase ImmA (M78 family)
MGVDHRCGHITTGIRNKGYQRFTAAHELGHYSLTEHHGFLFEKGVIDFRL